MAKTISVHHKQKTDTSTNWSTNNPVLLSGEIGYDSDTHIMKVGDGTNHWNDLSGIAASTAGMANTSLSNLTSTGKNIGNWSSNVSNCLVEIPQDINLTLSSGTLTLKSGSKLHVANGNLDTTNTTTSDITITSSSNGEYLVIRSAAGSLYMAKTRSCLSGTIAARPSSITDNAGLYFATDENKMYLTGNGGTDWYSGTYYSLPLGKVTVSGGAISSIDQVFNGLGYIGLASFILPGVKAAVPDGFNNDGSLKNTIVTRNSVYVRTMSGNTSSDGLYIMPSNGNVWTGAYITVVKSRTELTSYGVYYVKDENLNLQYYNGSYSTYGAPICHYATQNNQVTMFNTRPVFHAVDYNDFTDLQTTVDNKADKATTLAGYGITDAYTKTAADSLLNAKANTNLDNLNNTGANISNWSSNVSNCITEIPQDIKLTLSSGTLTLNAGSKVYKPDGTTYTLTANKTATQTQNETRMYFYNGSYIEKFPISQCFSGTIAPSSYTYMFWFDTTNNVVKKTVNGGSTWESGWSLPFAICTATSGALSSIDQVFNGLGYIGSTVFALPGVKAIAPHGRNSDGTLKNYVIATTQVSTAGLTYASNPAVLLNFSGNIGLGLNIKYFEDVNRVGNPSYLDRCIVGSAELGAGGVITSFNPKTTLHAVDYNDFTEELVKKADATTSANTSLSNLTSAGKNIGNWSSNVTNCIVEIPQDIKLTLSNSTLTLKTGSNLYACDGGFTNYTTPSDISNIQGLGSFTEDMEAVAWVLPWGTIQYLDKTHVLSGATNPSVSGGLYLNFNTTDNKTYFFDGSNWAFSAESLPIAIITTTSNGTPKTIKQVFNGFGYIGRTVFALPGVKALIPDGRNADGTLKSVLNTLSSVKIVDGYTCEFMFNAAGISPALWTNYAEQDTQPTFVNGNGTWYNPSENKMYQISNYVVSVINVAYVLDVVLQDGDHVKSVTPKLPFRVVDYNDLVKVVPTFPVVDQTYDNTSTNPQSGVAVAEAVSLAQQQIDDTTLHVCNYYMAPTATNSYTWVRKYKDGWVEQGGIIPVSTTSVNFPISFANEYSYIQVTAKNTSGQSSAAPWNYLGPTAQTATGFTINGNTAVVRVWEAKGIAATYSEYSYITPGTYTLSLAAGTYEFDLSAGGGGGAAAKATLGTRFAGASGGTGAYGSFTLTLAATDTLTIVVGTHGNGAKKEEGTPSSTAGGTTSISTTSLGTIVTLTGGEAAYVRATDGTHTATVGAGGTVTTSLLDHNLSNGSAGSAASTSSGKHSASYTSNPSPYTSYGYGGGWSYDSTKTTAIGDPLKYVSASNGGDGYVHIMQIA